jgi:lipoyl(octanoyl) transferase
MLDRANRGERWFRLYRWAPHCLSFGRHEPALRRYDRAAIERLGLDVVRRPTGGRAVWHADELTYAVAVPADEFGGLRQAYLEIHQMLLAALRSLGVTAELAPAGAAAAPGAGACFASPAGGEILLRGRKVVGSAQLREGTALLQHGSILLAGNQRMVHQVTLGDAPPDLAGPITDASGAPLPARRVAEAVADAASLRWGGAWTHGEVPVDLLEEAAAHEVRYRSPGWTWRA